MSLRSSAAVIATFNQETFVRDAVMSVADQVDEVVVVDDCSRDGTWEVLVQLSHPRVRVRRNERNLGVSRTFNAAVAQTDAEVVLIQGGDDISHPFRAVDQIAALQDPEVSLVFSRPEVISSMGSEAPDWLAPDFFPETSTKPHAARLLFENNYICAPSVALRRADYELLGGFHPALDLLQDYDLWLKASELGAIVELERPVVKYRKHAANLSRDYVGVDGPRHRRLRAEQDYVRGAFIEGASRETRETIARGIGLDLARFSAVPRTEQVALILLSHPDPTMKRRGCSKLLHLLSSGDLDATLADLGLDAGDVQRFMFEADHDNMAQVSHALRADAARDAGAIRADPIPPPGVASLGRFARHLLSKYRADTTASASRLD